MATTVQAETARRTIPERSAETQRIAERFLASRPGDEFSDRMLKELSGLTDQVLYARAYSARRIVQRETNGKVLILRIEGFGYRHATETERLGYVRHGLTTIHRECKRRSRVGKAVQVEAIAPDLRAGHIAATSLLEAVIAITATPRVRQLTAKVAATTKRLPVDATLAACLGHRENGDHRG